MRILIKLVFVVALLSTFGAAQNIWEPINSPASVTNIRSLAFKSNGTLMITDRGGTGVWRTTNHGSSWTQLNSGLTLSGTTVAWTVRYKASADVWILSTTDTAGGCGVYYRSVNDGATWTLVSNTPQSTSFNVPAVIAGNGNILMGGCKSGIGTCGESAPYYSTDNGVSANAPSSGPACTYGLGKNPADNAIWLGTEAAGVYKSIDNGVNYSFVYQDTSTPMGGDERAFAFTSDGRICTVSKGGAGRVVCSTSSAGTSWTISNAGNSGRTVFNDDNFVLYYGSGTGVERSSNGGTSWQPFTTGLPSSPVVDFAIDPTDGRLYAATSTGVVYRTVTPVESVGGGSPAVTLDHSSLSFGAQSVGTTSASQAILLTNTGTASLTITSIVTSGDFGTTHNCPIGSAIAVNGSCTLNVTFTPTQTGTRTGTITITDNATNSPQTVTLSGTGQSSVSNGDNTYCALGNVSLTSGQFDGPAQLPSQCFYTGMDAMVQSTPVIKTICPSGCDFSTIASALVAVQPGWTLKLQAVNPVGGALRTYTENNLNLPMCAANNWCILETDQISNPAFPGEGNRMTPCFAGVASQTDYPSYPCASAQILMPKIITNQTNTPVITNVNGGYWRLIGLNITSQAGTRIGKLIQLATTGGDHVILDRSWVHGGDSDTGHNQTEVQGNVQTSGNYLAVIDSWLSDTACLSSGACTDSNGVGFGNGSNDQGPVKIVNNFISSSGEAFIIGGSASTVTPHDIEIRRNHLFKPLFWKKCYPATGQTSTVCGANSFDNPSYDGVSRINKNNGELKNAQRVLFEGNVGENNWGQGGTSPQGDQPGAQWLITPKNQSSFKNVASSSDGAGHLTATSGTYPNVVDPTCPVGGCHVTFNGTTYFATAQADSTHITVSPTPPSGTGTAKACTGGTAPSAFVRDATYRYNRGMHSSLGMEISTGVSDCGDYSSGLSNVSVHDNVFDDMDGFTWSLTTGNCCAWSVAFKISNGQPQFPIQNLSIRHNTALPLLSGGSTGNAGGPNFNTGSDPTLPGGAVSGFVFTDNIFGGGLKQAGSFCKTPTTVTDLLNCSQNNVGNWCHQGNIISTGDMSGEVTWTQNTSSPGCAFGTLNQLASGYGSIGFVSLNNADGGDYTLAASSPYKGVSTAPPLDPGADIATLNTKIQGVADSSGGPPPPPQFPQAAYNPTTLTFAGQTVGTTSSIQSITLTSSGTASLTVSSITISGDFAQTNNCIATFPIGGTCSINVSFTPTVAGARNGIITVTSTDPNSPQTLSVNGNGITTNPRSTFGRAGTGTTVVK